ncbi:MAG TPA: SCP2 sterol-binding domain-containing protein [Steroidobacteraceae bacterium]|nr:SCP2 sterol-binding domain-containing protein [Steroidobacteraceae bacterium]
MLAERLQAVLDRGVEGSPRARELLAQLDGRHMQVIARYTPWQLTLRADGGRLLLERAAPADTDLRLAGTPIGLLALLREEPAAVIRRGDVTLTGDAEAGQRFQELVQLLRPDLEAGLARVLGDIPAHGIGTLLRSALDYGRASLATQARNVGEYLAHERRVLVPRAEAAQFLEEVDALREDADRLAARVARLEEPVDGA